LLQIYEKLLNITLPDIGIAGTYHLRPPSLKLRRLIKERVRPFFDKLRMTK
jgi:hypothetical protein